MKTPSYFSKWFDGGWPELVCLDLDGTLVDSVPDIAAAVDAFLAELGAPLAGEERVRSWVGFGSAKLIEQALEWADIDSAKQEEAYRIFLTHYHAHLTDGTTLYPNVKALLKAFKHNGVPVALITNKPSVFVKPMLDHFELTEQFGWLLGGDTLEEKKPSAMPLLHCSESIEALPENCLMIGDSITDFKAASNAGFKCALVTYGYNQGVDLKELGADAIIDDLAELLV
ncbi:phosphoglycolate phosphatase [Marinomonas sp. UCMA 3892]|jgi:phosphoglycolate phosphatase|uniref:Phosphoglycolate phosphatase n=1 Tax=Marinomonas sp. (strain MWYL1) TaxID=400668 RepID=A6VU60_MARMS|nr:phosphoglycolate phosphatase [Marinomonas sp. UCMA 3892]NLV00228.1 phosphoglycolate phosphatase [Marinomonas sp. UCMA 3892]